MPVIIDRFLEKTINTPLHKLIWKIHRVLFPLPQRSISVRGQAANDLILDALNRDAPCLIGKFGSIELEAIIAYLYKDQFLWPWRRFYHYVSGEIRYKGWTKELLCKLSNNAGFFSTYEPYLSQFAELYLNVIPQIDILHLWLRAERLIAKRMQNAIITQNGIAFHLYESPWTQALEGKKVLVIHPFEKSIKSQYIKRELLFQNSKILPDFELITLKAINSAGGEKVPFDTWFDALESMTIKIDQIDFDIALIGAGAYSLPLGAHIKSGGKKAVHLGGQLQFLFGIYGKRHLQHPVINRFINENWIRPMDCDKINNYKKIENGCYW